MILEEKVELLTNIVLYDDKIARLVLSCSLGIGAYNAILDIMDNFDKKPFGSYNFYDIEREFEKIGVDRQTLKHILIIFYSERRFINTLTNYLKTNYESFGNVSYELETMYNDLVANLHERSVFLRLWKGGSVS
ncbi:hypothetical protein, partial [Campylobacter fetus]